MSDKACRKLARSAVRRYRELMGQLAGLSPLAAWNTRIDLAGAIADIGSVRLRGRLEKRLAGLLQDLAAYKRMTVGSCLEEILLHTNEGVEPHTKSQLKYIEELKKKHGIDYDSHASYRFVEE